MLAIACTVLMAMTYVCHSMSLHGGRSTFGHALVSTVLLPAAEGMTRLQDKRQDMRNMMKKHKAEWTMHRQESGGVDIGAHHAVHLQHAACSSHAFSSACSHALVAPWRMLF